MTTMFTLKDLADAVDNVCENGDQRDEIVAILRSLEAQPQQASKPLSDAEIESGVPMHRKGSIAFRDGVRWAEQRHGIKERG